MDARTLEEFPGKLAEAFEAWYATLPKGMVNKEAAATQWKKKEFGQLLRSQIENQQCGVAQMATASNLDQRNAKDEEGTTPSTSLLRACALDLATLTDIRFIFSPLHSAERGDKLF